MRKKYTKLTILLLAIIMTSLVTTSIIGVASRYGRSNTETEPTQEYGNDYPIVFVHGLMGWGSDELGTFNYWGGLTGDIIGYLNNQGHRAYEAVIGPFSSNRHRAIELYYFLKGGTVDYGAYLAARHDHERFGRTFPGILSQWDNDFRIHLVGHSMGGLTARELANLIASGCSYEIAFAAANTDVTISPLLAGNTTGAIHSITTIATPNNGTTATEFNIPGAPNIRRLPNIDSTFMSFTRTFLPYIVGMSNIAPERIYYDFKLDHFGLVRNADESFLSYMNRVFSSSIWQTEAVAIHSVSVHGVTENAANLRTLPDIYYFSHSMQSSVRILNTEAQRMLLTTNPHFISVGVFQTLYRNPNSNPPINIGWAANDGLVNTVSMPYPFGHARQSYDGNPVRGVWNYHPITHGWDHLDVVGIGTVPQSRINEFYLDIAQRLHSLSR